MVAVFSNGKAWQFSDWKYKQPVDLFHRCACCPACRACRMYLFDTHAHLTAPSYDRPSTGFGAFVHYDDEPVRGDVKGWNMRFFKVSKTKRHMDGICVSQFWMQLADWLKVHKPLYLRPVASAASSSAAAGATSGAAR